MGSIQKTMTEAAQAANQSNGRQSSGPATPEGKERSKMNALKHGKYARRPDPVKLLLAGGYGSDYGGGYGRAAARKAEEAAGADEAERARLRAEMVRCYAPRDDFARLQAEELADLKFELWRLERVKEVMWRRERELLDIEQHRRQWLVRGGVGIASDEWDLSRHGYVSLPDSPAKFLAMRSALGSIVREAGEERINAKAVQRSLNYLYGGEKQSFCGKRLREAAAAAAAAPDDNSQGARQARENLKAAAASQLDRVAEQLAICVVEDGPLSETGQAARLLEATNSRKWGWVRSQENFLRRSIDRKVKVLIDLRYEDAREALAAARKPATPDTPGRPDATGTPDVTPNESAPPNESGPPPAPALPAALPPELPSAASDAGTGAASAPAAAGTEGRRSKVEGRNCSGKKRCRNRGTNPPSALESTNGKSRGSREVESRELRSQKLSPKLHDRRTTIGKMGGD